MNKFYMLSLFIVSVLITSSCASTYTGKKVRYIELRSRGCYICQRMDKVTDDVVEKYSNEVDFSSYSDTNEEGDSLIKKYRITKFPANLMFDSKGNLFFRYDGVLDLRAVEEQLFKAGVGVASKNITGTAVTK